VLSKFFNISLADLFL